MAVQVVDGGQRQPPGRRQRLRGLHAHEQGADESRSLCDRHQVGVVQRGPGLGQRVVDHVVDQLEMVAGGDLGHHSAVAVVDALRGDDVGAHRPVRVDDRRAGVVAAGLQREDAHGGPGAGTSSSEPARVAGVRHITSASSPLSW